MDMKNTAHSVSPVVPRGLQSQTPGEEDPRRRASIRAETALGGRSSRSHLEMILLQDFRKVDRLRVKRVNEREIKRDSLRNSLLE